MGIFQKLGGINHRFTGKEKIKNFVEIERKDDTWEKDPVTGKLRRKEKKREYYKPDCVFVEIRYQPINWWPQDAAGLYPESYLKERCIWVPKYFLNELEESQHENTRLAA